MTRTQMFNAIFYERRLEFAFEGKRFWALRRWKKTESTLDGKCRIGAFINLKTTAMPADFATTRDNENLDLAYTNYFTITFKQLDTKYTINWLPAYYFFAIPQSAIDNNPSLVQNNAWVGAFDPLK
ncbi:RagB/SusD family nutrient uptake outer membrane protein [Hymenobacter sp. HMF4947]|uniref:RagB/SusD family nutrient uptake outer membrane protein n=1 Tax=Hymenobacter ginkgonis TaxID=2682976 RepID=A0A7K1TAL5_9BACT|nr:RagB/SusD family nutrient uptake outer membrane protein [Hymenobacter ginkgonis]MVN75440.1 RagB/SusD family nutrient uptake outer membrane protein [Hymenobacter ginkgonis]